MYTDHDLFLDHCRNRLRSLREWLRAQGKDPSEVSEEAIRHLNREVAEAIRLDIYDR